MQWNISLNCCLCTNLRVNPTDFFKETEKLEISELRALLRHKFNLTSSLAGSVDVLIPEQGHDDSNYSQDERKIRQHRLATALKWKQSYIQYHAITEKLELLFATKIDEYFFHLQSSKHDHDDQETEGSKPGSDDVSQSHTFSERLR